MPTRRRWKDRLIKWLTNSTTLHRKRLRLWRGNKKESGVPIPKFLTKIPGRVLPVLQSLLLKKLEL